MHAPHPMKKGLLVWRSAGCNRELMEMWSEKSLICINMHSEIHNIPHHTHIDTYIYAFFLLINRTVAWIRCQVVRSFPTNASKKDWTASFPADASLNKLGRKNYSATDTSN